MKVKNYVIISTDAEKVQNSMPFYHKNSQQTRNRRKLPQLNKCTYKSS